jgi:hypothetical protein
MSEAQAPEVAIYRRPIFRMPSWRSIKRRIGAKLVRWGLDLQPEDNLVDHARRELRIAGYFKDEGLYGGMLGNAVVDMRKIFAMEGHSGMSASIATSLFERVSRFEPLTPLTGEEDEWVYHDGFGGPGYAQNKRCSHVFKENGEAYDINGRVFREPSGACYTSRDSRVPVTFPYTPTTEYVDVKPDAGANEA